MSKPKILYVDDEANNLTVFEASMPDSWEVLLSDSPISALNSLVDMAPWVIITDQRMPNMKGVEFLQLAKKLVPEAIRIIVTGYSDEDLVIESVRKAQVFDYLRKPWEADSLEIAMKRAIEHYRLAIERTSMIERFQEQAKVLEERHRSLEKAKSDLELANHREMQLRRELECWVPPFVLEALKNTDIKFPIKRDIVGVTFDIVGSSRIHGQTVQGRPLRAFVLENFSQAILRNGGFRESQAGDSAYAHFGLMGEAHTYGEAALAAAREFRVGLRSLAQVHGFPIECGIALHAAKGATVDIHTVQLHTPNGVVTQKSFDTTSSEIDLLHRIEKITHKLPGSNIIITQSFLDILNHRPKNIVEIGKVEIAGQTSMVHLYLLPSDQVTDVILREFLASINQSILKVAA